MLLFAKLCYESPSVQWFRRRTKLRRFLLCSFLLYITLKDLLQVSGDETITPRGFRNLPGNTKFRKTLQILKERILVNSIKQEYTIQQANYYLERKAATAA